MVLTASIERLVITEAVDNDVDALLAVALSNPEFTGHQEGSAGEPGRFDRGMLERDLAVASVDPARQPLMLGDRTDDGRAVGWVEVLDEHPRDGVPWIGLPEVHQQEQRKGYRTEAVAALLEWARSAGAPALRLGVDEGNRSGFVLDPVGLPRAGRTGTGRSPTRPLRVAVMEIGLDSEDP